MRTVVREEGETLEALVCRCYTVRWIDGNEAEERVRQAMEAVLKANPCFDEDSRSIQLPELERIPYLNTLIDNPRMLHPTIHEALAQIQDDPRLYTLSFIDPIRLGCEELGIAVTPEVAAELHRRLEGHISFDQERYEEIRDHGGSLHGSTNIRWVPEH